MSGDLHARMVREAQRVAPLEACGLVVTGATGEPRFVPLENRAASPHRFEIDPADIQRVVTEADRRGEEIVGYFHSHPDGPPFPSSTDLAEWPDSGWAGFIVGRNGLRWEVRAFRMTTDGGVVENAHLEPGG